MIDEAEVALVAAVESREAPLDVYADWLEERGDERAVGMRWLAERERRPRCDIVHVEGSPIWQWRKAKTPVWQWHLAKTLYMTNQLPKRPLQDAFPRQAGNRGSGVLVFDSFAEALDAAARAVGDALADGRLETH